MARRGRVPVDIVALDTAATKKRALKIEGQMIEDLRRVGCQLLNVQGLPRRQGPYEYPPDFGPAN